MQRSPILPTKIFAKGFHLDTNGPEIIYPWNDIDFDTAKMIKGNWLYGSQLCLGDKTYIIPENLNLERINTLDEYLILDSTLCRATDFWSFKENDPNFNKQQQYVYDRDIITLRRRDKIEYQFLIWYMEEGSTFIVVPWTEGNSSNQDFLGYPVNYHDNLSWDNFCLMAHNVYGDFDELRVDGNIYSIPTILNWVS